MAIFYLIPPAILWIVWAAMARFGAPWWVDYPLFGFASAATGIAIIIVILSSTWPR